MLSDYGVMRDLVLQGAAMGVVHVLSGEPPAVRFTR